MKSVLGIVIMGVLVAGVYWINALTRSEDGKSLLHVAKKLEVTVETAQPEQRDIIRTVQAPGEIEAFAEVDISSEVVAKILEMPVEEGDSVKAGDLLCRLDDAAYRASVRSAEANVAKLKAIIRQAEANVTKAELDYAQQKRLIEVSATSQDDLTRYRALLTGAQAVHEMRKQELIEGEARLQSANEDLAKTVIKAPISGIVSQLFAKQGEVVVTGTMNNPGTRIMVISDLSKMQVRCRVDEADAPLVAAGQIAGIYLQSDTRRNVPGSVFRVATKGTKRAGRDVVTFETLVLIEGDDPRVKPGMTANVEIEVDRREQTLTIPVEAVVYRKRRDLPQALVKEYDRRRDKSDAGVRQNIAEYIRLVFCVHDGKARPHLVQIGISDVSSVEILDGLTLADTVVTGPYRSLDQLKDETPVKLDEEQAKNAGDAKKAVAVADGRQEDPEGDSANAEETADDDEDDDDDKLAATGDDGKTRDDADRDQ